MTPSRFPALAAAGLVALALGACTSFEPRPGFPTADDMAALTAPDPYTRGKLHLEAGRTGLAVHQFRLALERQPDSVPALNGLAIAYDRLGRQDLARHHFERALARDRHHVATLNNLGRWHMRQGRAATATAYLDRALAEDPGNAVVLANLRLVNDRAGTQATRPEPVERMAPVPLTPSTEAQWRGHEAWIERSGRGVQTLVTRPDPEVVRTARETGLDPRWLSYVATRHRAFVVSRRPEPVAPVEPTHRAVEPPATLASAALRASGGWCDLLARLPEHDADLARTMDESACPGRVASSPRPALEPAA
jgi:tetratricopeptide (TPR) repeat protein